MKEKKKNYRLLKHTDSDSEFVGMMDKIKLNENVCLSLFVTQDTIVEHMI